MDRGMISDESLKFLGESGRRYLLATRRGELAEFQAQTGKGRVETAARTIPRWRSSSSNGRRSTISWHGVGRDVRKERAIRRRQRRGLAQGLKKLCELIDKGKLKNRDKILERVGRLKGRFPKARPFVKTDVTTHEAGQTRMVVGSRKV